MRNIAYKTLISQSVWASFLATPRDVVGNTHSHERKGRHGRHDKYWILHIGIN